MEAFFDARMPGTWNVRVFPYDVSASSFRMRAKLEAARVPPPVRTALLPNLRTDPPFELSFIAPANPLNGLWPPDPTNPPLDVLGVHPLSCTADEIAEDGARRCLRFSAGPENAGAGPWDLRYTLDDRAVYQHVHYSDGTTQTRPAGTYSFHHTHGHFHYEGIMTYELFKVHPPPVLVPAGEGRKSGFDPADQRIAEWGHFGQEPADSARSCGDCSTGFWLSTGWGDHYRWQRPGQYVEFGDNTDGYYVVRATVDAGGFVLEAHEDDNTGYAYVLIVGDRVRIIERGRGLDPWDPAKVVLTDRV